MKRTPWPITVPALFLFALLAFGLPFGAAAQTSGQGLPRAASADEVAKLLAKPPAGLEIVDIRPSAQYADYALPGSLNLDAATVLSDETFLAGTGPLLLVDKDGTEAFALAGLLASKTSRPVLALKGGLAAWWAAREMGEVVKETPLSATPAGQAPAPSPAGQTPAGAKDAPAASPDASPAPAPGATPSSAPPSPSAPQPPAVKNAGC